MHQKCSNLISFLKILKVNTSSDTTYAFYFQHDLIGKDVKINYNLVCVAGKLRFCSTDTGNTLAMNSGLIHADMNYAECTKLLLLTQQEFPFFICSCRAGEFAYWSRCQPRSNSLTYAPCYSSAGVRRVCITSNLLAHIG